MDSNIDVVMDRVSPYLDVWDGLLRQGHSTYTSYPPEFVIDHDSSTQAHCTFRHILAEAHRTFDDAPRTRHFEVRGQNLWLFEDVDVLIRFKKTDENGVSSNYPTKQACDFERGFALPGIPPAPMRLNVGYLLDDTGLTFVRSQVAFPAGKRTLWCAAIIPQDKRLPGQSRWHNVTREPRLRMG